MPAPAAAAATPPTAPAEQGARRSSLQAGGRKKKAPGLITAGSRVRLKDLVSKAELNGKEGVVISLGEERNLVLLDDSSTPIALKPANMYPTTMRKHDVDPEAAGKDEPPDPWLASQQQ